VKLYATIHFNRWLASAVALLSRDSRERMDPGWPSSFGRGTLLHAGEVSRMIDSSRISSRGRSRSGLEDLPVKSRLRGNKLLQQAQ